MNETAHRHLFQLYNVLIGSRK